MEKQTTPSVNPNLLRITFVLLSLMAACTAPFALVAGVFGGTLNTKAVEAVTGEATRQRTP
jgi:hypothetical protein